MNKAQNPYGSGLAQILLYVFTESHKGKTQTVSGGNTT